MPESTHNYRFSLKLNRSEIARYYQGDSREVCVRADNGQRLRFAARHLRPFLCDDGIQGSFLLTTDKNNRFKSLSKLN